MVQRPNGIGSSLFDARPEKETKFRETPSCLRDGLDRSNDLRRARSERAQICRGPGQ